MATKYLDDVGLKYFYERLKLLFAAQTDFGALKTKVDNMVAQGGEPNTIDSISINGTTAIIDSNKNVDITVPTKTSDLTNDSNYVVAIAGKGLSTNDYDDIARGKVDKLVFDGNVLDSSMLPSYVDDVIEGYPRSGETALGADWLSLTSGGDALAPETGKIYVLMADSSPYLANSQFRWSGTTYVKLSDGGVSSITTAEIDTIVDGTGA